ncbi:integrase [Catellatospora sp. TT07R-123]|uniref:site-specific integrase n=1 Tax=Catellatospora sp. TT07R-123 TaxID=2733863 RepID=UPI001B0144E5|nr:tyrosine-type recombinase/integrase [Catellatospora sp. TT07R-123]GHJ47454.1 integrase [Catellatospora sp. TT07R-123]
MGERRGRGEGGLYWDEKRQRFIAEVTIGYTPAGKRIVRKGSGKTKTEARAKLKEVMRDHEDGLAIASQTFTVAAALEDWLAYGLAGLSANTVEKYGYLVRGHIIPDIGARKLQDLSATDVDRWLAKKAKTLSTSTVRRLRECLNRAVDRAMARDKVKRNVVALCATPKGQPGRPSKSLTFQQAMAVLDAAEDDPLESYVVTSLMVGGRTEELRPLPWDHVDLDGQPDADPPVPPSIQVWRSVRDGGDTKTRKSRRTLALPARCVVAMRKQRVRQDAARSRAGARWKETGLVYTSEVGTALDAANVRRGFRRILKAAGLDPKDWTPRELRHSFVSVLSDSGMSLEEIAELCGHAGTRVTEAVYRHQLRPVILHGAIAMDLIFGDGKMA